jgi:alkaline phosphatase D
MPTTRRRFLQAVAAAATLTPACKSDGEDSAAESMDRTQEPPRWEPEGEVDSTVFPYGIQVGDVLPSGALVSVHSTELALEIFLVKAKAGSWVVEDVLEVETEDGFHQLELEGLEPDTAYSIAAYLPEDGRRSTAARFRTALPTDGWRRIRFGATSCLGRSRPCPNLSRAGEEDYDFFCFLGDAVYADGSRTRSQYWSHWDRALQQQGMRDLTSSTSIVATWDDHEVGNNWSWDDVEEPQFNAALETFRAALPQREGPGGTGIWRRLGWGRVLDIFVLDCRGERTGSLYISEEQQQWLEEGLSSSVARFKIILNSVPIIDYSAVFGENLAEDRWQGHPEQRRGLLEYIENQGIGGVLWLSGDFHFGQIARLGPPGAVGDSMYEVLAGPSGSTINPLGELIAESEQFLAGVSAWNHTRFTCDPQLGSIHVEFIGDTGDVLEEMVLEL